MNVPSNREIDAWIAEHVMKLSDVGFYRRKSEKTSGWEKCEKDDTTPDNDRWPANLYYLSIPGNTDSVFAVPQYTDNIEEAFSVLLKLRSMNYHFVISDMYDGVNKFKVEIWGIKHLIDSMRSKLVEACDIHPAKAICVAVCNLFELLEESKCPWFVQH